ncbi:GNAT family N-acetyltransferase [archaeon]|nr:MAG: GNAT family N-acetyltransferase [archaeon]
MYVCVLVYVCKCVYVHTCVCTILMYVYSFAILSISGGRLPPPSECELYIVDRDALFSYHPLGESLLQRVWGLYTSAHYKNSPNDLQVYSKDCLWCVMCVCCTCMFHVRWCCALLL